MTRIEFMQYCYRKLGAGMIKVNVTDDQAFDRIDDAYRHYLEKHFDAFEAQWLAYIVTDEDVLKGHITLPEDIQIVDGLLYYEVIANAISTGTPGESPQFTYQWQMVASSMNGLMFGVFNTLDYYLYQLGINEMKDLIGMMPRFDYTHRTQKMVVYDGKPLTKGQAVFMHVKRNLPQEILYDDHWFQKYATACIKEQWGNNLKKHSGIQTLGGVQVNGQQIYDEAIEEKTRLEEILIEQFELPPEFSVG